MSRKNVKNTLLRFTGILYEEVINLHFGSSSTRIESTLREPIKSRSNVVEITDEEPSVISNKEAEYFLDSKKRKVKLWPIMKDVTSNGTLPLYTNKPCRNCHHPYVTHPVGCPIKYYPHDPIISTGAHMSMHDFIKKNNFSSDTTEYFETQYMFCSFPCVKSFILDMLAKNSLSSRYGNSLTYLTLMFMKMNSYDSESRNGVTHIPKADSIDNLIVYGGHLTIDEYRLSFGNMVYNETISIKKPIMFATSSYVEEVKL